MMALVVRLLLNAVALAAAVWLVGGITLTGATTTNKPVTLLVVAAIFAVVNAVLKPVVQLLTLPLLVLTLGLLTFVINALMLMVTSGIAGAFGVPFDVDGFWPALFGALIISIVSWLLNIALPDRVER